MNKSTKNVTNRNRRIAHGPTVFLNWKSGKITTKTAMQRLNMTKETFEKYVSDSSQWCYKQFVYETCCDYIDRINTPEFKKCLMEVLLKYQEDELIEEGMMFGIDFIMKKANILMVSHLQDKEVVSHEAI